jgi:membrane protein DedA with SNARE-associated domain
MTESVTTLVAHYGLVAVFVGTFFEGEGILVAAGVLAGEGMLHPLSVWATAAAGGWLGHLAWFLLGRWLGRQQLQSRWRWFGERLDQADRIIQRHPGWSILLLQYLYGVRMIGAAAFGLTHLSLRRFLWYQLFNCLLWAALIGSIGYFMGEAGGRLFHDWGKWLWLAASVGLVIWLTRYLKPERFATRADH